MDDVALPNNLQIRKLMLSVVDDLYSTWKKEISVRLNNLKLKGEIFIQDISVSKMAARLPNNFLRFALDRLENDLMDRGFECQFKFDDVDSENWCLSYRIELSEELDEMEETEIIEEIDE